MADAPKSTVQWFPGHMAKTRRLIKESLPLVDGVAELRDARLPEASTNPELNSLIERKPKIIILNKSDLADENATARWLEYFAKHNQPAVAIDCKTGRGINAFKKTVSELLREKSESNAAKGMAGKALRIMIVGIPNTGKSTLINKLTGNGKAKTEDRAGVTRHNQWYVAGDGLELLDTPGVLWPKFDDPAVGDKLAFTGGIKDDILDKETLSLRLLEILSKDYPERLTERYGIKDFEDLQSYELLEAIGRKRGMLISGGEVNTERAAIMLFDELRAGKLGKITFERP